MQPFRMRGEPGPDTRHAGLRYRQFLLIHEIATDRAIRLSVLVGVAEPDDRAILELYATGTLYFEQERIQRAVQPDDFMALQCWIRRQLRARVIRHHGLADQSSTHALALELRDDRAQVHRQQVIRR